MPRLARCHETNIELFYRFPADFIDAIQFASSDADRAAVAGILCRIPVRLKNSPSLRQWNRLVPAFLEPFFRQTRRNEVATEIMRQILAENIGACGAVFFADGKVFVRVDDLKPADIIV